MRRIIHQLCGPSDSSELLPRSLLSTSVVTGTLWWCAVWMGHANYSIESKRDLGGYIGHGLRWYTDTPAHL